MSSRKKILIIESGEALRAELSKNLTAAGFDIAIANSSHDVELIVNKENFSLIIADVQFPDITGDILKAILKKTVDQDLQMIVTTSRLKDQILRELRYFNKVQFRPKPFDASKIVSIVNLLFQEQVKPIDVKVINPLIVGALQLLSSAFESPLIVGKPYLRKQAETSGDISSVIGLISSTFRGNIALSFSSASYLKVISKIYNIKVDTLNDDARDIIADLMTTIIQQAKDLLSKEAVDIVTTKPIVIMGDSHSLRNNSKIPPLVIVFQNEIQQGFRIEVSTQNEKEALS